MEKVRKWLLDKLRKEGWRQTDLARRADIDPATLSRILSGQNDPSCDTLMKIAKALNESPERVFRMAGLITSPDGSDFTDDERELIRLYRELDDDDLKEFMLHDARIAVERAKKFRTGGGKGPDHE